MKQAAVEQAYQFLFCEADSACLAREVLDQAPESSEVRAALACHLAAPHTPAMTLIDHCGLDAEAVRDSYRFARTNPGLRRLVRSLYYPHRLRSAFAAATVAEWLRRPEVPQRILARESVLSETMEIHPTRGSCNYRCRMCLWSDQAELTYATKQLDTDGLMTVDDWLRVLDELAAAGVRRLIVSGGGEALINPDLPAILHRAADLGFEILVYTTGFAARPGSRLFAALLRCHRIRFSVHSPDAVTYDHIAGTRPRQHALARVTTNLAALLEESQGSPELGIGMVVQQTNHTQIEAMTDFAEALGADWLDIRKDEVDVSDGLEPAQLAVVRAQLRAVRTRADGATRIDLGDELVALANGITPDRSRTTECLGRWFRPTIGAFGHLTPCDLKAEPRFAATGYDLGNVKLSRLLDVVATSKRQRINDDCTQCMPSSRTGNAIVHKLLADIQAGVGLDEQPFV